MPNTNEAQYDDDGNVNGIVYTYTSKNECVFNTGKDFQFSNTVICDKNETMSVPTFDNTDKCHPKAR